jgi:hypothetical protein
MGRRTIGGLLLMAMCLAADSGAGVQWTKPAGWKAEAERPMRLAGQGGSVDANLDRWIGQFLQTDGKPSKSAATIAKRTIHGWAVTTVDVSGAYTGMGGPMAKSDAPAMPGYRLLAAIVEGPQGSVFFKCTGPQKAIAMNQPAFDKMLASLGPAK